MGKASSGPMVDTISSLERWNNWAALIKPTVLVADSSVSRCQMHH